MTPYVLDACALIAYINDEEGADLVSRLFDESELGEARILMGKLNLLEVYYGIYRELGLNVADEVLAEIKTLPIEIVSDLEDDLFRETARIKASYKVSLADALALGLASISGSRIITSDHHEFDVIEKAEEEKIDFLWIR